MQMIVQQLYLTGWCGMMFRPADGILLFDNECYLLCTKFWPQRLQAECYISLAAIWCVQDYMSDVSLC